MPNMNTLMAIALMACITLRLKLVGLLGSFFRKKYIYKYKQKAQSKKAKSFGLSALCFHLKKRYAPNRNISYL